MYRMKLDLPKILFGIFLIIWSITVISLPNLFNALVENVVIFISLPLVLLSYYKFRLSNFSYVLIFIFAVLHVTAAHYGYWNTPWGNWLREVFDWERNHYDRIIHFLYGFLMVPVAADLFKKYLPKQSFMSGLIVFAIIFSVGGLYEIAEFIAGIILKPDAGLAFLGFQGDIWDTQKDMVMQLLGIIIGLGLFRKQIKKLTK